MTAYLVVFLLLIAAGATAILVGIYLLAGLGWVLVAGGAGALGLSVVPYKAFYR